MTEEGAFYVHWWMVWEELEGLGWAFFEVLDQTIRKGLRRRDYVGAELVDLQEPERGSVATRFTFAVW